MSPLWRDEVGVYLSPHRLCLVRLRRGARPKVAAEHEQRLENPAGDSWEAALEAFASVLREPSWGGTPTRVVLADHWVRYIIVPWVGEHDACGCPTPGWLAQQRGERLERGFPGFARPVLERLLVLGH